MKNMAAHPPKGARLISIVSVSVNRVNHTSRFSNRIVPIQNKCKNIQIHD